MAGTGVLVTVGDLVEDIVVWPGGPLQYATDNPAVIGGAEPVEAARAGHLLALSVLFSPGASARRGLAGRIGGR